MLLKIANIYLYATNDSDSEAAKKWLDDNEIEYTYLRYADESQHPYVFHALNSWFNTELNSFPIVVFDEIHDDRPSYKSYIAGLEAIEQSTLAELYQLGL